MLTVVPVDPDVGLTRYSVTGLVVGVGCGFGFVPQLLFMEARVSGPTNPVAGMPCAD